MRIVHTEASCGWGGQELRILSEASGMIERGHEVTLLCPSEATIFREAPRHGVPVVALPIGRKRPAGLLALRRWIAAERPDVVNTHSSTDSWLAALACASLRGAPPIVRTRHISAPIPKNAASAWLYKSAARHVVTTGEALRLRLIEEHGLAASQVTSVPTGIDTARFAPGDKGAARAALGLDPEARYIGIVATLRSWKGHAYLVDAFARLGKPEWRLLVIGDGPQRPALAAKVADMGLDERVSLVGQQQHPWDWLRTLDIFCLPSYANEGVPQALLQAMLTALPVVTTPVGAILEAASDETTALIVPPKDSERLAAALLRLIDAPDFAKRLGEAAREHAKANFSREAMLDRMEGIFRGALGE